MFCEFPALDKTHDFVSSAMRSGGINPDIEEPMISLARYPKIRSAPAFQRVMIPLRSLTTIASLEDSTIAANWLYKRRPAAFGDVSEAPDAADLSFADGAGLGVSFKQPAIIKLEHVKTFRRPFRINFFR